MDGELSVRYMAAAVVLFYMMLVSNDMNGVVGCNVHHTIKRNPLLQHLTAFVVLYFLVILAFPQTFKGALHHSFLLCLAVYAWFFIIARLPFSMFALVILLLLGSYLFSLHSQREDLEERRRKRAVALQNLLAYSAVSVTIVAFVLYVIEKRAKHGTHFSWAKLFINPPKCKACKMGSKRC